TGTVDTVSASNVAIAIRKAKKTGKVALKIPSGEAELAITANSLQNIKATGKPLAVALKHVEILIPPAVLKQLVEIRNVKQVQFEAESLSAKEAVRLADKATNTHLFSLADRVFELSITVLKKGGKKEYLTKPDGKLQVTLPVRDQKAVKLGEQGKLTVCRFAKTAKAWQDKGGKYNAATKTITFSTDRFSKFAIMEVKTVKTPGIEVREKTASFTDITGHWAQDDIKTMFELGLVKGVSATEFAPDQTVTRAEFATLLVRATGVATAGVTGKFTDVPPGVWYFEVVNAAAAAGLVGGYGDNIFKPDELITREQMASMVTRALVYKGQGVTLTSPEVNNRLAPFKDRHEIAGWARQSVAEAVASNIISGRAATVFAPQANATRGEGAVMILRMYNQF
ncbi:S-layer homology domain-containing protein, partial [Peptococcaceae bacterium]|nr:S-layer homology domain-containing protein [Peptococcaceae bacterium]